jgi:DNA invertase Pin-like site-specific DNA recombinase
MPANHLARVSGAKRRLAAREKATDEAREQLRAAVLAAFRAGESKSAIARAASVSRQYVTTLLERG